MLPLPEQRSFGRKASYGCCGELIGGHDLILYYYSGAVIIGNVW